MNGNKRDSKREEILSSIVSDYRQKTSEKKQLEEKRTKWQQFRERTRRLFIIFGICIIVALTVYLVFVIGKEARLIGNSKYWVEGGQSSSDYKVNECVFNLQEYYTKPHLYRGVFEVHESFSGH